MKERIISLVIIISIIIFVLLIIHLNRKDGIKTMKNKENGTNNSFDYKIIKEANNTFKDNYMISPVSIAYALEMLKEGATNNTRNELESVLNDYKLPKITNIKNRISLANLLFINTIYKKDINKNYIKLLQDNYSSDLLIDEMKSPDKINTWVSNKTFKMINNALETINPQTILGLANAIAIDVEWEDKFNCELTTEEEFNLKTNEKMKTPMMHSSNDVAYIQSDNAKGIIKDYERYDINTGEKTYNDENSISLEYIAILPNNDIDDYLKDFDKKELDTLLKNKRYSNSDLDIYYSLPKYTFDFDYKKFLNALINLGIKDAFTPAIASFDNMKNKDSILQLYVNDAIHKSHIELNENGTKASAVTILMLRETAAFIEEEPEKIYINFNKPFVFIIKEKESDNIWFYGVVKKPMDYKDNPKCDIDYK